MCAFILKLFTNRNDSPGARNGRAEAGTGGGAEKKGRTGEKASGGDKQAAKTHRTRGETARKTEGTGEKSKILSFSLMNDWPAGSKHCFDIQPEHSVMFL